MSEIAFKRLLAEFYAIDSDATLAEPNANHPVNQQDEGQDCERRQDVLLADGGREHLLLSQEERSCGDEQTKAHAPEVARDSWRARNASAQEHAKITASRQQGNSAHEEIHAKRNSRLFCRITSRHHDPQSQQT